MLSLAVDVNSLLVTGSDGRMLDVGGQFMAPSRLGRKFGILVGRAFDIVQVERLLHLRHVFHGVQL